MSQNLVCQLCLTEQPKILARMAYSCCVSCCADKSLRHLSKLTESSDCGISVACSWG